MIINNTNSIIYETCIDESLKFFNEEFSFNFIDLIKKAFNWIIDKINRAINFIKSKLNRKNADDDSTKDSKTYSLEKPFRKPRSNKTKEININGPIHAGSGKFALDKPFNKARSNKTKDIPQKPTLIMKSKLGKIPVSREFVKKCYMYSYAETIQKDFIESYCNRIVKIDKFKLKLVSELLEKPSQYGNSILNVKENIFPEINKNDWEFDNSNHTNMIMFFPTNSNKSPISALTKNVDIIGLLKNFKKHIEMTRKNLTNTYKKINDSNSKKDTETKEIKSYLLKYINIIKSSSSWYISQLTKLTNFNIVNELNKLLSK